MRRQIGEARLAAAARAALGQRRIRSAEAARSRHERPVAIMACAVFKLGAAHLATWRAGAAGQRRPMRHRRLFMVEAHRLVHAHSRRAPRAASTHDGLSSQGGFSERVEWWHRRPRRGGHGTSRRAGKPIPRAALGWAKSSEGNRNNGARLCFGMRAHLLIFRNRPLRAP